MANIFDTMNAHINEMMGGVKEELGKIAPVAPGQRERSNQEKAALWRSLTSLPEGEMRSAVSEMAARAGHSPFEESPCEVCSMIAKYGLGVD